MPDHREPYVLGRLSVRQVQQEDVPTRPFDQRADRGAATFADDQVAFPVPRDRPVLYLGRTIADHDHVRHAASAGEVCTFVRSPLRSPSPKTSRQFLPQGAISVRPRLPAIRRSSGAGGQTVSTSPVRSRWYGSVSSVLQRAVLEVLDAIYEVDFLGFSSGFRPGRSQHQALDALGTATGCRKVNRVLDADIR